MNPTSLDEELPRLARPEGCFGTVFTRSPIWVDWLVWTLYGPGSGVITYHTTTSLGVLLPSTTSQGLSRAADGRY